MKLCYAYRMALLITEGKYSCHKSSCKLEVLKYYAKKTEGTLNYEKIAVWCIN